jgi:hypothetical protein
MSCNYNMCEFMIIYFVLNTGLFFPIFKTKFVICVRIRLLFSFIHFSTYWIKTLIYTRAPFVHKVNQWGVGHSSQTKLMLRTLLLDQTVLRPSLDIVTPNTLTGVLHEYFHWYPTEFNTWNWIYFGSLSLWRAQNDVQFQAKYRI